MKVSLFASLLIVMMISCRVSRTSPTVMNTSFDQQGHRGCRGLMPENTIPAMLKALELGVTTLEMDAVITKDSQVILSHEPFFNHEITTRPDGQAIEEKEERSYNIYGMTYAETQRYDVGLKSHPRFPRQQKIAATKPLLGDVIDSSELYARQYRRPLPYYNIETKTQPATDGLFHPAPGPFVDQLIKVIQAKGIRDRIIIQSFDIRTLQYLHQKDPGIKTALLIEGFDNRNVEVQLQQLGFLPTIYSPEHSLVTPSLVQWCHSKKIRIIPWTVNDKERIQQLKEMGVDGIISDYPDLFL